KDYASTTGQELPDAMKELATTFADPVRGLDNLEKKIGLVDVRTYSLIQRLAAQGRTSEAQRVLFDAMSTSLGKHVERTSALAQAWEHVTTSVSNYFDRFGRQITGAISSEEKLQDLLQQRA